MSAWAAALASLGALCALSGCFEVKYDCRLTCGPQDACPAGLFCLTENGSGLCAPPNTKTCYPGSNMDAATDRLDAREAGMDARDAGPDAEAGTAGPPSMLCHNGSCLTLPDSIRKNLVLLLWPSNLPPVGSPVSVWKDQSGQGNDARALYPSAPPLVVPNGVQLDSKQLGAGFLVANSPSLDFGSDDFAVIVVAGLSSATAPVSLFRKSDSARTNSRKIALYWALTSATTGEPQAEVDDVVVGTTTPAPQPSVGAYAVQRMASHIELHFDGTVFGSTDLPASDISTTNAEDVFIGTGSFSAFTADSVEAVIVTRGPIGSSDLNSIEKFLRTMFATMP
jgi:hypothetical protein